MTRLEWSTSAYYAFTAQAAQGPSQAEQDEAELVAEIRRIHAEADGTYASPRVTRQLARNGRPVNHKRVERLMRAHDIVGHRPRRRRSLTKQDEQAAAAPDLVGRLFDPDHIDVTWCGDITYAPTDEGWLYLATTLDLASRRLLDWSMNDHMRAELVTAALEAAVATRGRTRMDDTVFHSDRGSQYTSNEFAGDLREAEDSPVDGAYRVVPGQRRRGVVFCDVEGEAVRPRALPHT